MNAKRILRWTGLFLAPALVASLPAFACSGPACPCQTLQQAVTEIGAIEVQAANAHTSVVNLQLLGNQEFLREALENSTAKVLFGQLAQQKSQSDDVKQFSRTMIRDYGDLSEQVIERVAKLLAVNDSKNLSRKDKQLAATLAGLSNPQFDEQYIRLMVKDYNQDLKKFSSEAALTQDPGVKIAAELGTSIVSQHLKLLEQIAERHSVDRGEPVPSDGE